MPEIVIVAPNGTEHVFPEGMDPKKAGLIVRRSILDQANAKPLSEPTTYDEGWWKGLKEGAIGGATGFVKGLGDAPGDLWNGVKRAAADPWGTAQTLLEQGTGVGAAKRLIQLPVQLRETADAMTRSATDPESWGRPIGSQVGQLALTAAPEILPAGVQAAGRGVSAVGRSPLLKRGMTAAAAGNAFGGNIPGAVMAAAVPPVVEMAGRGVQAVGRGMEAGVDAVKGGVGRILERGPVTPIMPPTAAAPRRPSPAYRATPQAQAAGATAEYHARTGQGAPPSAAEPTLPVLDAEIIPPDALPAGPPPPRQLEAGRPPIELGPVPPSPPRPMPGIPERRALPPASQIQLGPATEQATSSAIEQALGAGETSSAAPAPPQAATGAPVPTPPPQAVAPQPAQPLPAAGPNGVTLGVTDTGEPLQGFPRVTARHQPLTPAAAKLYRDEYGTKNAAPLLKSNPAEIDQLAPRDPNAPVQLPGEARRRIDQKLAGMTPEQRAEYAARSKGHGLANRYIQDAIARLLASSGE